jgi:subtilisin family serine protease
MQHGANVLRGSLTERITMASKSESATSGSQTVTPDTAATPQESRQHSVKQRKGQFVIAPRRVPGMQMMGLSPLQFSAVEQALRDSPDIDVIDKIGPRSGVGTLTAGAQDGGAILIARMSDEKASALSLQSQGQLIVERDQPLQLLDVNYPQTTLVNCSMPTTGSAFVAEFLVLGANNTPVKDAEVYLFGSLLPATGITDGTGRVKLTLYGETSQSLRRLYVKPRADYWSFSQEQPDISSSEMNVIGLRALSDWPSLANFPAQQQLTWGQKAMRLDQLPAHYRGQGIRVAIVDSGAANAHQDLSKITRGYDVINKTLSSGWNVDTISHGSHCAGVIAGMDSDWGIRGFAPDAEVHACKLFPGGQISQLIDALEYCIEKQIDVVNLSLGGAEPSEALEQQILRAKQAGIACIVAAGNSGGPVQYPASSSHVLAVAAIGKLNEFPADSYHVQTMTPQVDSNGFFSARFSCFGQEIDVCAPGVAVTSSVPDNNFAAWDGTSMAAPHITGLAALVLAHHPDFQGTSPRSAERVERLFQIIKLSCRPVMVGDQRRTGFGLPDVLRAVGLAPAHPAPMMGSTVSSQALSPQMLQVLREPPRMMPQTYGGVAALDPYASFRQIMSPQMTMQHPYGMGIW